MHPIGDLRLCMGGMCCVDVSICVVSVCLCVMRVCVVNLWPQRIRTISPVPMPAYIHYADASILTNAIYTVFFFIFLSVHPSG